MNWKRSNIPIIGAIVIGLGLVVGIVIIPEFADPKEKSIDIWEENAKAQSIPTLEKGMVEAMKSDCGSTNTILCEKLDKIIENQEIIKDQLTEIYDMDS
jgi:hypothetical protein